MLDTVGMKKVEEKKQAIFDRKKTSMKLSSKNCTNQTMKESQKECQQLKVIIEQQGDFTSNFTLTFLDFSQILLGQWVAMN